MPKSRQTIEQVQEPMGIVISGWPRAEVAPRVHAYVWGPVPDEETEEAQAPKAA
jgi:hypothetical protein